MKRLGIFRLALVVLLALAAGLAVSGAAFGQSTSGSVTGAVTDTSGGVVPNAAVQLSNTVSGFTRSAQTDATGTYHFFNIPFDHYVITTKVAGFSPASRQVQVSTTVPVTATLQLHAAGGTQTVNVEASNDMVEQDPTFHTDVDRSVIDRTPVESPSSALSALVTTLSPGVAADSNGLMHGLGDHAENSFSLDGQQITDQQSKVFSNQIAAEAVQSMEVIDGAPTAEYGDKTSLVVKVTTRSGQGVTRPTGVILFNYGTFGTSNAAFNVAYGGEDWGNFFDVDGLQSGRFLDAPEFNVFHDKGNEENLFDRIDRNFTQQDSVHLDLQYTRSWFQTPDDYEDLNVLNPQGVSVGKADQRSKIETWNISPTYTRVLSTNSVANLGFFARKDAYSYIPSNNPFADFAPDQQGETVGQFRTLLNVGVHGDLTYVKGPNNFKVGGRYEQTVLRENDSIGIIDPTIDAGCVNGDPSSCTGSGTYSPVLLPYDLRLGGTPYNWLGRADVKELALYGEDQLTLGDWVVNFGMRGDFYNGLTVQRQAEPRAGVTYNVKKTATVLRASYARTQETPFNENLVLSSTGCADPVLYAVFATLPAGACVAPTVTPFNPGFRNEFHAGIGQGVGRHLVFNGEYIWKYTHNAYDFSVLGTTPITFPIEWRNSKIPGFALSAVLSDVKGLSVRFNASSVAARFFNPQLGGVGATPGIPGTYYPFRIDHDEHFNQTTHLEYAMPFRKSLFYGFNWRYDSGLVAGSVPCYNSTDPNSACAGSSILINGQPGINLGGYTGDQEFQAGLVCNGVAATPNSPIMQYGAEQCLASQLSSKLVSIPAPGTEDDDHNPQRIVPRTVFDMQMGDDNLAHFGAQERYKLTARVSAINVTNTYGLYNFLSTFSGTHYLTPRTVTGEVALHF